MYPYIPGASLFSLLLHLSQALLIHLVKSVSIYHNVCLHATHLSFCIYGNLPYYVM